MNLIRLYRGDNAKIKEFQVSKTNKKCLVGSGIYLTNKIEVADTYRLKTGKYSRFYGPQTLKTIALEHCATENKGEAIAASFSRYFEKYWMKKNHPTLKITEASFNKYSAEAKRQYHFDIEDGLVKFRRVTRRVEVVETRARHAIIPGFDPNARPKYRFEKWIVCEIENPDYQETGFITIFEFDQLQFSSMMVKLGFMRDVYINDLFSEITREHEICWHKDPSGLVITANQANAKLTRRYFEPYGFKGIEYPGGLISKSARHRAFVVWDEDFVNAHRTGRIRHRV